MTLSIPALRAPSALLALAMLMLLTPGAAADGPLQFRVTYDATITDSFTGRVYVMFDRSERREPRFGPSWRNTQPFFALDVVDWKPDTPRVFDDDALGFPGPLSAVEPDTFSIQAVLRRNPDSSFIGTAPGTGISRVVRRELDGSSAGTIDLHIDTVVEERAPRVQPGVEVVRLKSDLLSAFHGRDIFLEAAVLLPKDYDADADREYPALYIIPGFGGDHLQSVRLGWMARQNPGGDAMFMIGLNPRCGTGHHVFADSANNGPCGQSLIDEMLPELERRFKLRAAPSGRFLTGASSGGWSSLWLQVTYPDTFGGVWSLCPDPVDFHDFQQVDLYATGSNMFSDEQSGRRPIGRAGGKPMMWYDDFAKMEVVAGPGGQLYSFDAVFSPRGDDGLPVPMFDRATGDVDSAVASAWRPYDIRLTLEENWKTLAPRLAGKLHVYVGDADNFFLDGAVVRLKATMTELGSDAEIEIQPGLDHGSVVMPNLPRMIKGIRERFAAGSPVASAAPESGDRGF